MGGTYPNQAFTGWIPTKNAGTFSVVPNVTGKTCSITCQVQPYKGKPEIVLNSPSQVRCEGCGPSGKLAAASLSRLRVARRARCNRDSAMARRSCLTICPARGLAHHSEPQHSARGCIAASPAPAPGSRANRQDRSHRLCMKLPCARSGRRPPIRSQLLRRTDTAGCPRRGKAGCSRARQCPRAGCALRGFQECRRR